MLEFCPNIQYSLNMCILIHRLSNLEELVVIHNELEVKSEAFSALLNPLGLMSVHIKSKA